MTEWYLNLLADRGKLKFINWCAQGAEEVLSMHVHTVSYERVDHRAFTIHSLTNLHVKNDYNMTLRHMRHGATLSVVRKSESM